MQIALISDIHANLSALRAVLADIDGRADIGSIYHLGDLTGYGPWPNETVELLRERAIPGIAGNYDSTIATDYKHCGCRADTPRDEELSHISYEWTKSRLSAANKAYFASLPFRIDVRPLGGHVAGPTVFLLHGNQTLNTVYVTEDRSTEFLTKMATDVGARSGDVICFGHTHKPWQRTENGVLFVNTGSVGRPKDGDWRACYAILSVAGNTAPKVEFVRVAYDVEETIDAIRVTDLPIEFAELLRTGGAAPVNA